MLADAADVLGGDRQAVYMRELTKKFEDIQRGTLADLAQRLAGQTVKGEIVVLIDRADSSSVNPEDIETQLRQALDQMSVRDAADAVAQAMGRPKREIYQMALALGSGNNR